MTTLLLRLRGPLQSWGSESRYTTRETQRAPTKSGVLGLLAAAQGRRRSDSLEDLAALSFGVRIDQPGSLLRDFQTAIDWRNGSSQPLSSRHYLSDARFVAAVSGDPDFLDVLEAALRAPRFPLYLGRRSCPANPDILIGRHPGGVEEALHSVPWQASRSHRKTRARVVHLPVLRDAAAGEDGDAHRDVPVSYDPTHRRYDWRTVVSGDAVELDNPDSSESADPFFEAVQAT
ncbi:type I-E CRISPR-associated protein Cas5/CasD [Nesterenkonia sp. CL21]|uniref:type I-E CRISPR-associated protein Cas5/CasD n=1 Tax=Nesterenkonia sp. CL21 TaxID=3064894 RepID=UPI00287A36BA|nr:type I-E CRISPR-associated protein Cas5/CasD [Nesterenkonia sp. CL21]MDS2172674.1 type I-E CRISPR-associated protein Cas5/CasD [Nesterenkonia sp. CL21]